MVRADIARLFHEFGCGKPGGANRSHDILHNMFECVVMCGHRREAAGNSCKGRVRCQRPSLRLLLLAALRWCEVKPNRIALIDAKTGPRYVLLGEAVPELPEALAEKPSAERVAVAIKRQIR